MENPIAALWTQNKVGVLGQLDVVEQACAALSTGSLDEQMRKAAESECHKMCGALGTFGFTDASRTARALNELFASADQSAAAGDTTCRSLASVLREQIEMAVVGPNIF